MSNHPLFLGMVLDIGREKDHMEEVEKIINAVADAADLRPCQIICRRRYPETIDARWIAVKMLHDEGFYSSRIASIMGMTPRNVNRILYEVDIRLSMGEKHLGNILERARKYLLK